MKINEPPAGSRTDAPPRRAESIVVRRSADRGHGDHGWLDSRHSFSFADYRDPEQMGFRSLRVINEDRVAPGGGFPTHPHRDMEIFSYVLEGALAHSDSLGNKRILRPGQVQLMSAGSGVRHSEFNPSATEPAHFLQIWILPTATGLPPQYSEWEIDPVHERAPMTLVISGDGRNGSAVIHQDADVWRIRLDDGHVVTHRLAEGRGAWLQVVRGSIRLNEVHLEAGDGAAVEAAGELTITATAGTEALLFDLA